MIIEFKLNLNGGIYIYKLNEYNCCKLKNKN